MQERYKPLRLPVILHDFHPKYYKYLPVFDGEVENITTERHLQSFEHFIDLFAIEYEDFTLRAFSQSLQGKTKLWFKNLPAQSIDLWDKLKDIFQKFWGNRRPFGLLLSEFHLN